MKTEGSYVTKAAQVQGSLIFTKDFVQFIPLATKVNQHVRNTIYIYKQVGDLKHFNAMVDYQDIQEAEVIRIINENAIMNENDQIKEAYMYDYLI